MSKKYEIVVGSLRRMDKLLCAFQSSKKCFAMERNDSPYFSIRSIAESKCRQCVCAHAITLFSHFQMLAQSIGWLVADEHWLDAMLCVNRVI